MKISVCFFSDPSIVSLLSSIHSCSTSSLIIFNCFLFLILPGQSNETEQDEQKEEKRTEENTMDFAANIEKVKEVRPIQFNNSLTQFSNIFRSIDMCSMAGIGVPYRVNLPKRFYRTNRMAVSLFETVPTTITYSL